MKLSLFRQAIDRVGTYWIPDTYKYIQEKYPILDRKLRQVEQQIDKPGGLEDPLMSMQWENIIRQMISLHKRYLKDDYEKF